MLGALKRLLEKTLEETAASGATKAGNADPTSDVIATAAAMLLLEVAWADHEMSDGEIALVENSLRGLFDLSAEFCAALVEDAHSAHEHSVGLYEYTRTINNSLDPAAKYKLTVALWRLAYSDQQLDSLEEHAIRKISELLYVPHAEFIRAKREARPDPEPQGSQQDP